MLQDYYIYIFLSYSDIANPEDLIDGNDDLFWAVMGGSPGNFGILTHILYRPLHDEDYPNSRMMKAVTKYSKEKHIALETIMAELTKDEELPKNYGFLFTILGPRFTSLLGPRSLKHKKKSSD